MPTSELSQEVTIIPAGTALEPHPDLCKPWPPMQPQAFREMTETITPETLETDPVILYEGWILDGRHRFQAAQIREIDCPSREYIGDDPAGFVIRENGQRRHSPLSVIAQCVVSIRAWAPDGRPIVNSESVEEESADQVSREQMAGEIGSSVSTIDRAKQIEQAGLGDQVRSGEMSSNQAINQIREGRPTQRERITRTRIDDDRPPDEFDGPDFDDPDFGPSDEEIARAESSDEDNFPDFGESASPAPESTEEVQTSESPVTSRSSMTKADLITALEAADLRLASQQEKIDDLESRVVFDGDTESLINAKDEEIRVLKVQVSEWMDKSNDAQRQIQALEKRLQEQSINA